ncbi:MAG: DsbA family protein [Beijerinckiaceae bacterium]|jgi:protein-disulfide isomerase|nr:DsbA family protein [Beijerinckiaceae bacterium]
MFFSRRFVLSSLAASAFASPASAQGRPEFYPIPVELLEGLERLNGRVSLGSRNPDVTIVEFFDYNCGFCRRTARDVRPLLQSEQNLRFMLVNYAVLGIPSVMATRVALAFSRQKADRYLDFHEQMFAQGGLRDAEMALAVATKLGADRSRLIADADSEAVTEAMKASARLGESFAFQATPSFLVGREGFSGALTLEQKRAAIRAFRQCEKTSCG